MPAASRSLKELFLAALAVGPAERAPLLGRECGHDRRLRRRLERMPAPHATPHGLLERLAPASGAPEQEIAPFVTAGQGRPSSAEREEAGTVIAGRYKLIESIGEGGM